MRNPMGAIQRQLLNRFKSQDPQMFAKIQKMIEGKSEDELRTMAQNIAGDRGINLSDFAGQFGIKL